MSLPKRNVFTPLHTLRSKSPARFSSSDTGQRAGAPVAEKQATPVQRALGGNALHCSEYVSVPIAKEAYLMVNIALGFQVFRAQVDGLLKNWHTSRLLVGFANM